jgi:chromosomal replication initiator protein
VSVAYDLDARFTFASFVVGPANRLAAAAARRVAEAPGTTYNPLFIYGGSGLGKTHLLTAIGHEVTRLHSAPVTYETVEHLMVEMSRAVEAGERDALRGRLRHSGLVLLDDIQFLAGQRQVQEELIRAWDEHVARGGQVVLTSDRSPQDIDALDERLVSRLSGGLILDMAAPDYETRVAIARRKADERGQTLAADVYEALGRIAFSNVRELQGALNRLIAVQELEGREVGATEVRQLLGAAAQRTTDEFGVFLSDISVTIEAVVEQAERRIADAILHWEGEGYRTRRLDRALGGTLTAGHADQLVLRFEQDVARLREIEEEIRQLDPTAPDLHAPALRDPDRISDAEALLAAVRDRQSPPPAPPPGGGLDTLSGDSFALRAARAVALAPGQAYNPLYVLAPAGAGKTRLLAALGNDMARNHGALVAFVEGTAFGAELIEALARGRVDGWRARYRRADVLLLDGVDACAHGEAGHDELFHLFEDLYRRGRQLVFSAASPPQDLPLPDRLRSRLESGLVVELGEHPAVAVDRPAAATTPESTTPDTPTPESPTPESATPDTPTPEPPTSTLGLGGGAPRWMRGSEKVLWEWPYPQDWLEESPD